MYPASEVPSGVPILRTIITSLPSLPGLIVRAPLTQFSQRLVLKQDATPAVCTGGTRGVEMVWRYGAVRRGSWVKQKGGTSE
jgi:hypothetical protein